MLGGVVFVVQVGPSADLKIPPPPHPNHNNFKVKAEMSKEAGDRIKQETGLVQLQKGVDRKAVSTG